MKKIVLCADDFGQSEAISRGIVELAEAGRLSAAGCMTEGSFWLAPGNSLPALSGRIDIGLHFNLTHAFDTQIAPPGSLRAIIGQALSGRTDTRAVAAALNHQLDRFESVLRKPPDFVDGHQHVHVLPGIRDVVFDELRRRYPMQLPYLRAVNPRLTFRDGVKLATLSALNSGFAAAADRAGFATPARIAGIYSLQPSADFAARMRSWLRNARTGDLLICHPGAQTSDPTDPIAATRPAELAYLRSPEFSALLKQEDTQLARYKEC